MSYKKGSLKIILVLLIVVALGLVFLIPKKSNDYSLSDSENFEEKEVSYYGNTKGYLAKPDGNGKYPGLILIHEWWGLNDNIKSLADDFAERGYVALAVDLYDGRSASTPKEAGALAGEVRGNVDEAFNNLNAAISYLKNDENVDQEKLASVGWCFGGGWAYEMAKNNLGVDASVMYYGRFSAEDDLSMMKADILGHFGEEDRSIAVDDVKEFEAKLKTLDGNHSVFIYPNAGHAFANEDNEDAYNEDAAKQAWSRTLEFLTKTFNDGSSENTDSFGDFEENIVGTWQSTEDENAIVVYTSNREVVDYYAGEELSRGNWELYENEEAEYSPSGIFLKNNINNEDYNYAIISLDNMSLQLNYLSRGNTLEYIKVNR